ncbi:MAG: type II toxin-antitoxin system VapC family toxin [Turneriella sp.]
MKLLLDTHALIWSVTEPKKIPLKTRRLIESAEHVYISTISIWEISLKYSIGKLRLKNLTPDDFVSAAKEQNFDVLTLSEQDALGFRNVPRHAHHDPFDRMLIWQAIERGLTLVSAEEQLGEYRALGLKALW